MNIMTPLIINLGGIFLNNYQSINQFFLSLELYLKKHKRSIVIIHNDHLIINNDLLEIINLIKKKECINITSKDIFSENILKIMNFEFNKLLLSFSIKNNLKSLGLYISDGKIFFLKKSNKSFNKSICSFVNNNDFLDFLFSKNIIPIIKSIGIDKKGEIFQIDADILTILLSKSLNADVLFLSDVNHVLDGKGNRISKISYDYAKVLINNGIINNGMKLKINSALKISKNLNKPVKISGFYNINNFNTLLNEISFGTLISFNPL